MTLRFGIPRRWLRFSIRTMLVVIALLCVWLTIVSNRARKQEELVRRVRELGGVIEYAHELDATGNYFPDPQPPGPVWLRRLIGDAYFFRVLHITVYDATNDDLKLIGAFPSVERLDLATSRQITDEGVANLSSLANLKHLDFEESPLITDRSMEILSGLPNLEFLDVPYARVSDKGLAYFERSKSLKILSLCDTQITADGAARLKEKLPTLSLFPVISELPSAAEERDAVQALIAAGARFMSAGRGFVTTAMFYGQDVTDENLEALVGLKHLNVLILHFTQVTPAGISRLHKSLPNVQVIPNFPVPNPEEVRAVAALQARGADLRYSGDENVQNVELFDATATDDDLISLRELDQLEGLTVLSDRITDTGLKSLEGKTSLVHLVLENAKLTDAGLQRLRGLTSLRKLRVGGKGITDAGLRPLAELTKLTHLDLRNSCVTGPGVAHLEKLPLTFLNLDGNLVNDEGLVQFAKLTNLVTLELRGNPIMDEGLKHLIGLTKLQRLSLQETNVSDDGLRQLDNLPKLIFLNVVQSRVTAAGVSDFKATSPVPGC